MFYLLFRARNGRGKGSIMTKGIAALYGTGASYCWESEGRLMQSRAGPNCA
jgi:hypothetical protein